MYRWSIMNFNRSPITSIYICTTNFDTLSQKIHKVEKMIADWHLIFNPKLILLQWLQLLLSSRSYTENENWNDFKGQS